MEKTKYYFAILSVLAIIIIVSNILIYTELSTQINSLQSDFFTKQTIYGTLEQRPYPQWGEEAHMSHIMVYVVSPTPNSTNPYYLSERGNVFEHLYSYYTTEDSPEGTAFIYDILEESGISVGDKIEVDGLVWYRSNRWTGETYTMLQRFSIRKP